MPLVSRADAFAGVDLELEGQDWLKENAATVLDAVVDAIVTMSADGAIQSVNQATEQLFGYAAVELAGQPVTVLMPEPYRSQHQRYVSNYFESGAPRIIGIGRELVAVRKDGVEFPIYLAVSEIPGGEYFVGIIRDLTEQKAAQAALAEQKEQVAQVGRLATMGEMTASIAHEINQPLAAIAMYAQAVQRLLDRSDTDLGKIRSAIEKLNVQALRAGDVIERVQRFVQNEAGERQWVDLNQLILDIGQLAQGDARMHGIDLRLDRTEQLPEVMCDPVQIQQVLLNLIRNAIDAMFDIDCVHGNQIRVASQLIQGYIQVEVTDSGPGVADGDGQVFTAFHTTKPEGMGMGLAICKTILEEHGGEIGYYNNADLEQGRYGAVFFFRIPLDMT